MRYPLKCVRAGPARTCFDIHRSAAPSLLGLLSPAWKDSQQLSAALSHLQLPLGTFGCPQVPLAALGHLWLLLSTFDCSQVPLAALCHIWLLSTTFGHPQVPLAAVDCTCAQKSNMAATVAEGDRRQLPSMALSCPWALWDHKQPLAAGGS